MAKFFIPLILAAAAIGLFVMYTNPTYKDAQVLAVQANAYEEALQKAQEMRTLRDELLAKRKSFSANDVAKLERILPDNVDNIRLIIDINNIAVRHSLSLTDVALGKCLTLVLPAKKVWSALPVTLLVLWRLDLLSWPRTMDTSPFCKTSSTVCVLST